MLYILFTFLITWACFIFTSWQQTLNYSAGSFINSLAAAVGGLSPMLVSLFLTRKILFKNRFFIKLVFGKPQKIIRYILAAFLFILSLLVYIIFGNTSNAVPIGVFLSTYFTQCLLGGGLEEFGWRGYLLPDFEKRFSIIPAVIIVGIIWSLWHLPLWFIQGSYQAGTSFILYSMHTIITACSLGAVWKLTDSILLCIMFHGWTNTLFMLIPFTMSIQYWILHILEGVIACTICFYINNNTKKSV